MKKTYISDIATNNKTDNLQQVQMHSYSFKICCCVKMIHIKSQKVYTNTAADWSRYGVNKW